MSAKAKEVRGFDHLILNMETCNVAVFDTAGDVIDDIEQTGWSMLYLAANVQYYVHPIVDIPTMDTEILSLEYLG